VNSSHLRVAYRYLTRQAPRLSADDPGWVKEQREYNASGEFKEGWDKLIFRDLKLRTIKDFKASREALLPGTTQLFKDFLKFTGAVPGNKPNASAIAEAFLDYMMKARKGRPYDDWSFNNWWRQGGYGAWEDKKASLSLTRTAGGYHDILRDLSIRLRAGYATWIVTDRQMVEATSSNRALAEKDDFLGLIEGLGLPGKQTFIGMYLDRDRDVKINLGGNRTPEKTAKAIRDHHKKELALRKDKAALLERELKGHDWYSMMSDDGGVARAGEQHMDRIRELARQVDPDVARRLWKQYAPRDFTVPTKFASGGVLDGYDRRTVAKMVNQAIDAARLRGVFRDQYWAPIHRIWKNFDRAMIPYSITSSEYEKERGVDVRKVWKFEVPFTTKAGRPGKVYGQVIAAGAGPVEDPLESYDVTAYAS
jgi:hypothetical protein